MKNNLCILFVDDEKEICEKLATTFELEDFVTLTASCGNEAIELLKNQSNIDVVISDIKMPNGDGLSLLKFIKNSYPKIHVILLSGFTEYSSEELVEMGALTVIAKPTNIDALIEYVKKKT